MHLFFLEKEKYKANHYAVVKEKYKLFIVSSNNAVLKLVNQDKNINFSFGYFE